MSTDSLIQSAPRFPLPHCMRPLFEIFPKMRLSQKFCKQLREIDAIGQRIFDSLKKRETEDVTLLLHQAVQDLKLLVSFRLQPSRSLIPDLFGPPCPSQEKIKLMYAAATVMRAWKNASLAENYEQDRDFTFTKILTAQILKTKQPFLFGLTPEGLEQIRKEDPFWQNHSDLFDAIVHLHEHRVEPTT